MAYEIQRWRVNRKDDQLTDGQETIDGDMLPQAESSVRIEAEAAILASDLIIQLRLMKLQGPLALSTVRSAVALRR